jgi:lauroyl/myristoyl acyltransferase
MFAIDLKKIITIQDFFTFFYFYPVRKLAAILPPKLILLISIPFVNIYTLLPVHQKRSTSIRRSLSFIFNQTKTKKEVKTLARQCFRNAVYTFIDDLILNKLTKQDLIERGEIKGLENLEKALLDKKGVLLVGGHFSGDRLSKRLLREIGFPIMSVRRKIPVAISSMSTVQRKYFVPIKTKILDNALKDCVSVDDKGVGVEILQRLRENGLVSILFDTKKMEIRKGIYCSFLGSQRLFPTNFLQIAHLTGAAVIPMLSVGNSSSFTITFGKKLELQEFPNKEEFISANLNILVRILELQIMQYPTQWLWLIEDE